MPKQEFRRRDLLRGVSSAALAMAAGSYSRVLGANDRVQVGVIGLGDRGPYLIGVLQKIGGAEIRVVCDIYGARVRQALQVVPSAEQFHDYRKMLDMKNVDLVIVAAPDHWHAPMALDAIRAGKDVYIEKPMTFRLEEGPKIVKAVHVNGRVCGVGTQQRSGPHYLRAKEEYIKSGKLGKITLVRTWWHEESAGWHPEPHQTRADARHGKPDDLDWIAFLGSAKWREWNDRQYFDFRSYLDFSAGVLGDKFVHWIDAVHMMMEQDDPVAVNMSGGIYKYHDGRTAPDTVNLGVDYRDHWVATFEHAHVANMSKPGIEFCGTDGRLLITRDEFVFQSGEKGAPPVVVKSERDQTIDHMQNFLACCRNRKAPNCDSYAGHRSAQMAHLGNLSLEQWRRIRFDPIREEVLPS
jgi:predicted dehydrogenase